MSDSRFKVAVTSPLRFVTNNPADSPWHIYLLAVLHKTPVYCIRVPHSFKKTTHPRQRPHKNSDFATPVIPVSLEAREGRDSLRELIMFWEQPGSMGGYPEIGWQGCLSGCISSCLGLLGLQQVVVSLSAELLERPCCFWSLLVRRRSFWLLLGGGLGR